MIFTTRSSRNIRSATTPPPPGRSSGSTHIATMAKSKLFQRHSGPTQYRCGRSGLARTFSTSSSTKMYRTNVSSPTTTGSTSMPGYVCVATSTAAKPMAPKMRFANASCDDTRWHQLPSCTTLRSAGELLYRAGSFRTVSRGGGGGGAAPFSAAPAGGGVSPSSAAAAAAEAASMPTSSTDPAAGADALALLACANAASAYAAPRFGPSRPRLAALLATPRV